jgi:hypothetical protein
VQVICRQKERDVKGAPLTALNLKLRMAEKLDRDGMS